MLPTATGYVPNPTHQNPGGAQNAYFDAERLRIIVNDEIGKQIGRGGISNDDMRTRLKILEKAVAAIDTANPEKLTRMQLILRASGVSYTDADPILDQMVPALEKRLREEYSASIPDFETWLKIR